MVQKTKEEVLVVENGGIEERVYLVNEMVKGMVGMRMG
jgi:hypothetical protein